MHGYFHLTIAVFSQFIPQQYYGWHLKMQRYLQLLRDRIIWTFYILGNILKSTRYILRNSNVKLTVERFNALLCNLQQYDIHSTLLQSYYDRQLLKVQVFNWFVEFCHFVYVSLFWPAFLSLPFPPFYPPTLCSHTSFFSYSLIRPVTLSLRVRS